MDFQINQAEIAEKITNEVLKEIEESGKDFTTDEIKEKINTRLDEIFRKYDEDRERERQKIEDKKEEIVVREFTNINNFGNEENDKFNSLLESIEKEYPDEEKSGIDEISTNDEEEFVVETSTQENSEDKKKFIQEFADLYKEELENSINSFKNAYESSKLLKETSLVEKVLICLFLVIPAILGGIITLIFILFLLLLWQIHILLKVFIKFFDKIETSIKETIVRIKKKITILKNSGGLFNRLIFSNSLYSIIMFNGILYMFIKGMLLPLKSAAEIDRILASIASKGVRAVTMSLRGPSELALSNLRASALRSGKTTLKENTKARGKLKLRDLLKDRKSLLKNKKDLTNKNEATKTIAIKEKIAQNVAVKLQVAQKEIVEQKLNAISEKIATMTPPTSQLLSNTEKERSNKIGLGGMIFDNVLNAIKDRIEEKLAARENNELSALANANTNNIKNVPDHSIDQKRIQEDLRSEAEEKREQYRDGASTFDKYGINENEFMQIYERNRSIGGENSPDAFHATLQQYPNLSAEAKIDLAIATADMRNAGDDLGDLGGFKRWAENHEEATFENYLAEKFDQSKEDLNNEVQEFARRYTLNGQPADCNKLIDEAMKEHGIDKDRIMTDDEFKKVALTVAEKFPEEQRPDIVKDLREHNLTYAERQRCREELQQEKARNKESFVKRENDRDKSQKNVERGGMSLGQY